MAGAAEEVVDEVRLLFNTLVRYGETLHAGEQVTMGMRAILEFLLKNGPTSVPAMARARRVTRQHVQALVNPLLDLAYVEKRANPAHRRSVLIGLTGEGERTIQRMRRRETRVLRRATAVGEPRLRAAAATLRSIRRRLEADRPAEAQRPSRAGS